MRLMSIESCKKGMKLAKAIFDKSGTLLLGEGQVLEYRIIERLEKRGISYLYIESDATTDLVLEDNISSPKRMEAAQKIETLFTKITEGDHKSHSVSNGKLVQEFKLIFKSLMEDMKKNKHLLNLLTHLQVKDEYVFEHSINVTLYSIAIAKKLGFSEKELYEIGLGAMLHDIGKLFIPKEILHKPGKLTDEEFNIVKQHTEFGFEVLRKEWEIPLVVAHCAFQHHEKLDGTGYPRGIKENEIHRYAKVLAVADVFDALTSHRSYRKAMLPNDAMEILMAGCHHHFDEEVVKAFKQGVAIYPIGLTVTLSTGEVAIVIEYNDHVPHRPIVRVIKDKYGKDLESYYDMDLTSELAVVIQDCDVLLDSQAS